MNDCKIQSNPDISGIGVRAAIYVQSLLCFAPALDAIRDRRVSPKELDRVRNQSTATLIMAFAILISTVIQGLTLGLTNFHATIVLSLSWMNNTNAFVFFLLYVQYKSQLDKRGIPVVKPTLPVWIDHIKTVWSRSYVDRQFKELERSKTFAERAWNFLTAESILILGSVHLSFTSGLGLWLWSDPNTFGEGETCAYGLASLGILGSRIPFSSPSLRVFSILIYTLFLLPAINLILPAGVFLIPFLVFQNWRRKTLIAFKKANVKKVTCSPSLLRSQTSLSLWLRYPSIIPTAVGLSLLFIINIIFIIDTELVLKWNKTIQQDQDDSEWGFGQTLAIILLVMPLRDLQFVDWILSLWYLKKETKRKADLNKLLMDEIDRDNPGGFLKIMELVLRGADPNIQSSLGKMQTALEICTLKHDFQGVGVLLERGADPNIHFYSTGDTLLDTAIISQKTDLSFALLLRGSETKYSDFSVYPLHAVARMGSLDLVQHLLDTGVDPNTPGGHYGTPLMAAIVRGNVEIVRRLLDAGARLNSKFQVLPVAEDDVDELGLDIGQARKYGTPLEAAMRGGNQEIVRLLRSRGAKE